MEAVAPHDRCQARYRYRASESNQSAIRKPWKDGFYLEQARARKRLIRGVFDRFAIANTADLEDSWLCYHTMYIRFPNVT